LGEVAAAKLELAIALALAAVPERWSAALADDQLKPEDFKVHSMHLTSKPATLLESAAPDRREFTPFRAKKARDKVRAARDGFYAYSSVPTGT